MRRAPGTLGCLGARLPAQQASAPPSGADAPFGFPSETKAGGSPAAESVWDAPICPQGRPTAPRGSPSCSLSGESGRSSPGARWLLRAPDLTGSSAALTDGEAQKLPAPRAPGCAADPSSARALLRSGVASWPPLCADPGLQTPGRRRGRFHSETTPSCPQWATGRGQERPLWVQSRRRRPGPGTEGLWAEHTGLA